MDKELDSGMSMGLHYKDIFENAKAKMMLYAQIVGQSKLDTGDGPKALAA